jgi:enoyl-CoA hydratase/carnithine racemase
VAARVDRPRDQPHVAVVTIDRPAKANALDPPTLRELAAAWRTLAADDVVRGVVLTGAGDRAFCGGMDWRRRSRSRSDWRAANGSPTTTSRRCATSARPC